ncbi:hypothetical protein TB1_018617 [Malus domestica]
MRRLVRLWDLCHSLCTSTRGQIDRTHVQQGRSIPKNRMKL